MNYEELINTIERFQRETSLRSILARDGSSEE